MKILFVVKNLRIDNGVASVIMNYYRELKNKKYKCDFLILKDVPSVYYDEIRSNCDDIFTLKSNSLNYFTAKKFLKKLFSSNNYDVVHNNEICRAAFIMKFAMDFNIKIRITHTHSAVVENNVIKKIIKNILKKLTILYSNRFFACSKYAGEQTFKNKKFFVIDNAILIDKFKFNKAWRDELRRKYKISSNKLVILEVARITPEKNPYFILELCNNLKKKRVNFEIWWLGSGFMEDEIKAKCNELKLSDNLKFLGSTKDINKFYSAADIFILPSIFEGFPVTGLEAQVAGLNCFFSSNITKEICLTSKSKQLLIKNSNLWVDEILNVHDFSRKYETILDRYSISNKVDEMIKYYNS